MSPAPADTLDIQVGARFIIEDGGASIRQFPFVHTFDNDAFVFFSEHGDAVTVHNVDGMRLSRDGGGGWTGYRRTNDFYLSSLVRLDVGTLWGMNYVTGWITSTNCACYFRTSADNGETWTLHVGNVVFPQPAKNIAPYGGFLFHRNMLVMEDGSLQGTMYGSYATDAKYRSVWVKSSDGGSNWSFVSTIAQDNAVGSEGYCEPCVERCADGSLLCVMRVGSTTYPLRQCRSTDGGLTWSAPTTLPGVNPDSTYSVDPCLCLMSNGVLALSYGRPDNKLLFSLDGNGESWGDYQNIYSGKSSGYTGIEEISPGRLLMVGDEGANWQSPGTYRIWGVFVDVTRVPPPEGYVPVQQSSFETLGAHKGGNIWYSFPVPPNNPWNGSTDGYSILKEVATAPTHFAAAPDQTYACNLQPLSQDLGVDVGAGSEVVFSFSLVRSAYAPANSAEKKVAAWIAVGGTLIASNEFSTLLVATPGNWVNVAVTGNTGTAVGNLRIGFTPRDGTGTAFLDKVAVNHTAGLPPSVPIVANGQAVDVQLPFADLIGTLASTGAAPTTVFQYWATNHCGTNTASWTVNGGVSNLGLRAEGETFTNRAGGLAPNAVYYYTHFASNSIATDWADTTNAFITGDVWVQTTDPTGRVTAADTAAFGVYRPLSCTDEDMVLNYTLSGTATDYAVAPASGTVAIAKGATNGTIAITPVYRANPAQTLILALAPGPYAIGSWNTATCTLAEVSAMTYNDKAAGNWTSSGTWNSSPAGGTYPQFVGDTAIIDSHTVTVNANVPSIAAIVVNTNGTLYADNNLTFDNPNTVTANGGTVDYYDSTTRVYWDLVLNDGALFYAHQLQTYGMYGTTTIGDQAAVGVRTYNNQGWRSCFRGEFVGPSNSTVNFTTTSHKDVYGKVEGNPVTHSNPNWLSHVNIASPMQLIYDEHQPAVAYPLGPNAEAGVVRLNPYGWLLFDNCRVNQTFPRNLTMNGGAIRVLTTTVTTEFSGDMTLDADARLYQEAWSGLAASTRLTGVSRDGVNGPKRWIFSSNDPALSVKFENPANTFSGGTYLGSNVKLYATASGALGRGPVTLAAASSTLFLDASSNPGVWTLTNDLTGVGTIQVEGGTASHTLRAASNAISPAVSAGAAGTLRVDGNLEFGPESHLMIDIAGGGGVAGTDFDRLQVDHDLTGLANAALRVNISPALAEDALLGQELVIVTSGSALGAQRFGAVTFSGTWRGKVVYDSPAAGSVKLTRLDGRPPQGALIVVE